MSLDPKKFGLTPSLVETVKEALKGDQHKIDANKNNKIDAHDFKLLRKKKGVTKEEAEQVDEISDKTLQSYRTKAMTHSVSHQPGDTEQQKADRNRKTRNRSQGVRTSWNKMIGRYVKVGGGGKKTYESVEVDEAAWRGGYEKSKNIHGKEIKVKKMPAGHYWSSEHQKVIKMHEPGTRVKTSHGVGVVKSAHPTPHHWDDEGDSHYKVNVNGKTHEIHADELFGKKMAPKRINVKEEIVSEAEDAVAKQIAAKKDAMQKQIQQKIAQKQMSAMQAKANKRLSSINASSHDDKEEMKKGGKEKIEVNPPLREAEELPKKVVKKGHEIAKSLIKHRANVREPYAVGMATAKKSAGIKD